MFDIMHTFGRLGWVKGQTLKFADTYNLIEVCDLIGFCYDVSVTQERL